MTDRIQELFDHLKSLEPEQAKEIVKNLPKADAIAILHKVLESLNGLAEHLVENKDEIWETKQINYTGLCSHEPGKFLHPGLGKNTSVYECAKCGESFTRKYYV